MKPIVVRCDDINDVFAGINKFLEKDRFNQAVEISSAYIYGKIFGPVEAEKLQINFRAMLAKIKNIEYLGNNFQILMIGVGAYHEHNIELRIEKFKLLPRTEHVAN